MREVRLNLGCGQNVLDGYENIDLYVALPGILRLDVRCLPHQDGSVDEILAKDILEHLPRLEWKGALADWVRVLKPGGTITIVSPEMVLLADELRRATTLDDWEIVNRRIFGGQGDGKAEQGQAHLTGFSAWFLTAYAKKVLGLVHVSHDYHNLNFTLVLRK